MFSHGTYDVRPFMAGGDIEPIERYIKSRQPGQLGLFGAPDVMVGEVLERPYSRALHQTVGDPGELQPGYVMFEGGGDVLVPPKLSLQNVGRANEITVRDLENLGPSGPVVMDSVEEAAKVLTVRTKGDPVGSLYVLGPESPSWVPPKRLRATMVASRDDGSILLVKGKGDSLWQLPGGDVKGGEGVADAAIRELREETGLATSSAERAFGLDAPNTWHEVSVARVNAADSIEAQAAEIGDWMWWDGQAAVPMNRSTRTILGRVKGEEPPKTGQSDLLPGRETYDWWPKNVSLGEIEATLTVGSRRRPIDPSLTQRILGAPRTSGQKPALYFEEGSVPPSRGEIMGANLEQLRRYYLTGQEAGVDYAGPAWQRAASRSGAGGTFDDFDDLADDYRPGAADELADDYRPGAADELADDYRPGAADELADDYRPGAADELADDYRPGAADELADDYRPGAADELADDYRPGAADELVIEGRGLGGPGRPVIEGRGLGGPGRPVVEGRGLGGPGRPVIEGRGLGGPGRPVIEGRGLGGPGRPVVEERGLGGPGRPVVEGRGLGGPGEPVIKGPQMGGPPAPRPQTPPVIPISPDAPTIPITPDTRIPPIVPGQPGVPLSPPIGPDDPLLRRRRLLRQRGSDLMEAADEFQGHELTYPAEVAHTALARVYTDVDSGEQEAVLLQALEDIEVTARQPEPAKAKTISGRNSDFDVGEDGSVTVRLVGRRGPHKVIEAGETTPTGRHHAGEH